MTSPQGTFDLAIAWTWQYDREFVDLVEAKGRSAGVTTYQVLRQNVSETFERLRAKELKFRYYLDRASDEDEAFHPMMKYLTQSRSTRVLNPHALQQRSADKATMHLEFLTAGIHVPYTIIITPYNQKKEVELSLTELARLGRSFIVKPANTTGGGIGVVKGAESLKDVLHARQHHKNDKYLLQETVKPVYFSEQRAWFRVFYAFGEVIPCWWDDQTHLYERMDPAEEQAFGLETLRTITRTIRTVCELDFFSTELACTEDEKFVAVDYVNELCDMRLQSLHRDGVPDEVVHGVADAMIRFVKSG